MLLQGGGAFAGGDIPDLCCSIRRSGHQALTIGHVVETPDALFVALHGLEAFSVRVPHFDTSVVGS